MILKPCLLPSKVGACEFVLEEKADIRIFFENIEEEFVEITAIDGTLEPTMDVVCLRFVFQCTSHRACVYHTAMHRDRLRQYSVDKIGVARVAEAIYASL